MRLKYEAPANEIEIDHLGYNAQQISDIATMRRRTNGMYILAGKVSSGKSTTLQRVLNKMFIDKLREITMYTIEEPVELDLPGAIQVPVRSGQNGVDGFTEAMKASLRSDPNVIVMPLVQQGKGLRRVPPEDGRCKPQAREYGIQDLEAAQRADRFSKARR